MTPCIDTILVEKIISKKDGKLVVAPIVSIRNRPCLCEGRAHKHGKHVKFKLCCGKGL